MVESRKFDQISNFKNLIQAISLQIIKIISTLFGYSGLTLFPWATMVRFLTVIVYHNKAQAGETDLIKPRPHIW